MAYVMNDPRAIFEEGLRYVPPGSRFAEVVRRTLDWCEEHPDWLSAWLEVERTYAQEYNWVHTLPNIAAVIIGALCGGGDFGRSICLTTMCGLDTDFTAGQTGGLLGTILGARALPPEWTGPVGDKFETYVLGFESLSTTAIANRTCRLGRRLAALGP